MSPEEIEERLASNAMVFAQKSFWESWAIIGYEDGDGRKILLNSSKITKREFGPNGIEYLTLLTPNGYYVETWENGARIRMMKL